MNWSFEFSPLVPLALFWALGLMACIIALVFLFTKKRGVFWRSLALTLLLLAIANPHLKEEDREYLKNIALVVIDDSTSQKIATRPETTEKIRNDLQAQLGAMAHLEVRWVTSRSKVEGDKDGTTLFADVNRALSTIPADRLAGVFLVTDGQIHDAPKNGPDLNLSVPVHALITGQQGEIDRRIKIVKAPRFGIVGSSATVQFKVIEEGPKNEESKQAENQAGAVRQKAVLKISREGKAPEQMTAEVGTTVEIPINFPHSGANFVEIELEPIKNELTLANNRVAVVAQGVRENLRVLLVSGEPHAGERTWRNLLKSDAAVDLVHFTILRPPEKQDGTPINELSLIAFPTRELFSDKLYQFDLIIFDRYRRRDVLPLLYLDNIARYVERGGAVLVSAGHTYATEFSLYHTPLSQVLPGRPTGEVIEQPYKPELTEAGRKHPVTRDLPGAAGTQPEWGNWFRLIKVEAPQGDSLMKGPQDNPLLLLSRVGKGRVALLLSDHSWLWARGYDGGGPHTILLRRLAHWLMKEPDLEEEFLSASGAGYSLTVERRTMKDSVEDVKVRQPNGKTLSVPLEKISPGIWRKTLEVKDPGLYHFNSGDLNALAHAGPLDSKEMMDVVATQEPLDPVLKATGGGAFWLGASADQAGGTLKTKDLPRVTMLGSGRILHGSDWAALLDRQAYRVKGVKLVPLFEGPLSLMLLAGLMAFAWYREGR